MIFRLFLVVDLAGTFPKFQTLEKLSLGFRYSGSLDLAGYPRFSRCE